MERLPCILSFRPRQYPDYVDAVNLIVDPDELRVHYSEFLILS